MINVISGVRLLILFFIIYCLHFQDVRFQFMNTISIADKPLHMTYAHARKNNRTTLDGAFELDTANKISANYAFGSANCKVKYTYIHGDGSQTFEPCYDFAKNAWGFAVSQRIFEDDVIKASYQTSSKVLNVDWIRNFMASSSFKVGMLSFHSSIFIFKSAYLCFNLKLYVELE